MTVKRVASERRLIVNADDFGQSVGINEGVVRAHEHGILTSASIMATGEAFEDAIERCRALPSLRIGLHLCLVEQTPLLARDVIPSLVGEGGRLHRNYASFSRRYFVGMINRDEVQMELEAQIQRVRSYNVSIVHFDSHQHIHLLPGVWDVVTGLAKKHQVDAIRYPNERFHPYMARDPRSIPRLLQMLALRAMCNAVKKTDLISADHFAGFFFGGRMNATNLLTTLHHLPQTGASELMCHPGCDENASRGDDKYDRVAEVEALCNPDIKRELEEQSWQLATYADLRDSSSM